MIFFFLSLILSLPCRAQGTDEIAALLEKYSKDEGVLKDLNKRVIFSPAKVEPRPMPGGLQRNCDGGTALKFEAKKNEPVNWGLARPVSAGSVKYVENVPNGTTVTTVKNHMYYDACDMNPSLIETISKLACSPELKALKVVVNSAFRDPIQNILEGGKSASQHLKCNAMDFSLWRQGKRGQGWMEVIPPSEVQNLARHFGPITGLGLGQTFTHVDVRQGGKKVWTYKQ